MAIQSNFPAIKPSLLLDFANTKSLDPRITFTRASTATYYDGVTTAKAEENLLIRSAEFDNATWGKTRSTVTANAVAAPDGTTTAESLDQASGQTSSGLVSQYLVLPANSHVFSVFAKANTKSKIFLRDDFNGARSTWFDLSAGTVGTTNAGHTASITSVGNSWYRCVIVFTSTAQNNQVIVGLADTDNSTTVTDSGGVYVWGAQLEQRSAVTAYTATTTQAITNYIPKLQTAASGVARFDNNPTTDESLGLLIEEQRTNLVTYSSEFDNAAWTKTSATILSNTTIAPDGNLTGDLFQEVAAVSPHRVSSATFACTSGTTYSASAYFKNSGRRFIQFYLDGATFGTNAYANFDIQSGVLGTVGSSATATITSVGNGWYRCTMTATATATSAGTALNISLITASDSVRNLSYTGDGWSGLFVWGAQLEAGAFATSYIPTVASQVTRSADAASMTGTNFTSWYASDQGTLYCELGSLLSTSTTQVPGFNMGDSNNRIELRPVGNSIGHARAVVQVNGSGQVDISITTLASTAARRVGMVYKVSDFYITGNGLSSGTSSSSGTLPVVSQALIGTAPYDSNTKTNGTIKKIAYYPLRVTNAQLQALTS